jgi:hypothetical protein
MAADESPLALPRDAKPRAYYGAYGKESTAAAARASLPHDIENDIAADAKIGKLSEGGRGLAQENMAVFAHLNAGFARRKTTASFDRGHPAKGFVKHLKDKETKYAVRAQKSFDAQMDGLVTGSRIVRLCERMTFRALALTLSGGEGEVPMTDLGKEEAGDAALPELCCQRWPLETKRCQLELENFSGRLVDDIKQDFYAMMAVSNMLASCLREADGKVKKICRNGKSIRTQSGCESRDWRVERPACRDTDCRWRAYPELFILGAGVRDKTADDTRVRPNREVPRREHLKKPLFHHNHKSNC